jgi:hypothetical protein
VLGACNSILGITDVEVAGGDAPPGDGSRADAPLGTADAPPDTPPGTPDAPPVVYPVYAHSDHVLYAIDLQASTLTTVGPFNTPPVNNVEDVITDLAVMPDNTIYAVSATQLYTADPTDGHVTLIGALSACGTQTVALTATPNGELWAGDYMGALCLVDPSTSPPTIAPPITMEGGLALSGDMVAVDNGTVFGTAYKRSDPVNTGTQASNLLVTINLHTGAVVQVGTGTGFPKLFGLSYADGKVFGFVHDGTGRVVTIDPASGVGTLYGTFIDPTTQMGISFAGAGVNALVAPH